MNIDKSIPQLNQFEHASADPKPAIHRTEPSSETTKSNASTRDKETELHQLLEDECVGNGLVCDSSDANAKEKEEASIGSHTWIPILTLVALPES